MTPAAYPSGAVASLVLGIPFLIPLFGIIGSVDDAGLETVFR